MGCSDVEQHSFQFDCLKGLGPVKMHGRKRGNLFIMHGGTIRVETLPPVECVNKAINLSLRR